MQGLDFGIFGPTLLDLAYLTSSNISIISYLMSAQAVAGLFGAIIAGPLVDRVNNWFLIIIAQGVKGLSNFFIPWTRTTVTLGLALFINGMSYGFFDPRKYFPSLHNDIKILYSCHITPIYYNNLTYSCRQCCRNTKYWSSTIMLPSF